MNAHNEAARLECLGWLKTAGLNQDIAMQVLQRLPLRLVREISEQLRIAEGERYRVHMEEVKRIVTGDPEADAKQVAAEVGRLHARIEELERKQ